MTTRQFRKFFQISRFKFAINNLNAMISLKSGRSLIKVLVFQLIPLGITVNSSWVRIIVIFLRRLSRIRKEQGLMGIVKYLKVCSVSLQQVLGGHFERDLTSLGPRISRTKTGYPRIIPAGCRVLLRNGHIKMIRFWLTLFSIYRDIIVPSKIKLNTITDQPSYSTGVMRELSRYIPRFIRIFCGLSGNALGKLSSPSAFPIFTSSPVSRLKLGENSTHPSSVIRGMQGLLQEPTIMFAYKTILDMMPYNHGFYELFNRVKRIAELRNRRLPSYIEMPIGKLGLKQEAAGKMRVFAMVDCWTQWLCYPLHSFLFGILAKWEMDGTFDQGKPLTRVPFGKQAIYSYDLSAATDRLPIELQTRLLSRMFGPSYASYWKTLLVGRQYALPTGKHVEELNLPAYVKYGTGQPMGALSSWAMLALTHHFIVQAAAWSSGHPKDSIFRDYAVLGDDIVIWNSNVAKRYLSYMDRLGVSIGLAKSVLSDSGLLLEFAKRTIFNGVDCSPVPLKEGAAARITASSLIAFGNKYSMSLVSLARFIGIGYRSSLHWPALSKRMKYLTVSKLVPYDLESFSHFETFRTFLHIMKTRKRVSRYNPDYNSLLVSDILKTIKDPMFQHLSAAMGYRYGIKFVTSILIKDVKLLQQRLTNSKWDLIQKSSGLITSGLLGDQLNYMIIRKVVIEDRLSRCIKDIINLEAELKLLRPRLEDLLVKPNQILLSSWMKQYFNLVSEFSKVNYKDLLSPKHRPSQPPHKGDTERTLMMWRRWLRLAIRGLSTKE